MYAQLDYRNAMRYDTKRWHYTVTICAFDAHFARSSFNSATVKRGLRWYTYQRTIDPVDLGLADVLLSIEGGRDQCDS